MWRQMRRRYRVTVLLFLLSAFVSLAGCSNIIEQRLLQTASGDEETEGAILVQRASADGVIAGEDNHLSQIVLQESAGEKKDEDSIRGNMIDYISSTGQGLIEQESYLASAVIGDGNLLAQLSNQTAANNSFTPQDETPYLSPNGTLRQRSMMLITVTGNNSTFHQNVSQTAADNQLFNSTLIQMAKEAIVSIGQFNSVTQDTVREFQNQTLAEYSTLNRSSSYGTIIAASNVTVAGRD